MPSFLCAPCRCSARCGANETVGSWCDSTIASFRRSRFCAAPCPDRKAWPICWRVTVSGARLLENILLPVSGGGYIKVTSQETWKFTSHVLLPDDLEFSNGSAVEFQNNGYPFWTVTGVDTDVNPHFTANIYNGDGSLYLADQTGFFDFGVDITNTLTDGPYLFVADCATHNQMPDVSLFDDPTSVYIRINIGFAIGGGQREQLSHLGNAYFALPLANSPEAKVNRCLGATLDLIASAFAESPGTIEVVPVCQRRLFQVYGDPGVFTTVGCKEYSEFEFTENLDEKDDLLDPDPIPPDPRIGDARVGYDPAPASRCPRFMTFNASLWDTDSSLYIAHEAVLDGTGYHSAVADAYVAWRGVTDKGAIVQVSLFQNPDDGDGCCPSASPHNEANTDCPHCSDTVKNPHYHSLGPCDACWKVEILLLSGDTITLYGRRCCPTMSTSIYHADSLGTGLEFGNGDLDVTKHSSNIVAPDPPWDTDIGMFFSQNCNAETA